MLYFYSLSCNILSNVLLDKLYNLNKNKKRILSLKVQKLYFIKAKYGKNSIDYDMGKITRCSQYTLVDWLPFLSYHPFGFVIHKKCPWVEQFALQNTVIFLSNIYTLVSPIFLIIFNCHVLHTIVNSHDP